MALFVVKILLNEILRFKYSVIITASAAVFAVWSYRFFHLPFEIQQAMCSLPFFHAGYLLKKYGLKYVEKYFNTEVSLLMAGSVLIFIWFRFAEVFPFLFLYECKMNIFTFINALAGTMGIFMVLKSLCSLNSVIFKRMTEPICYIGRNTLVILCWHSVEQATFSWSEISDAFNLSVNMTCFVRVIFNIIPVVIIALMQRFKAVYKSS